MLRLNRSYAKFTTAPKEAADSMFLFGLTPRRIATVVKNSNIYYTVIMNGMSGSVSCNPDIRVNIRFSGVTETE